MTHGLRRGAGADTGSQGRAKAVSEAGCVIEACKAVSEGWLEPRWLRTHAHIHTYTCTHTHTRTHTHTHTHPHTHSDRASDRATERATERTTERTNTSTYIHAYSHTYTCVIMFLSWAVRCACVRVQVCSLLLCTSSVCVCEYECP